MSWPNKTRSITLRFAQDFLVRQSRVLQQVEGYARFGTSLGKRCQELLDLVAGLLYQLFVSLPVLVVYTERLSLRRVNGGFVHNSESHQQGIEPFRPLDAQLDRRGARRGTVQANKNAL